MGNYQSTPDRTDVNFCNADNSNIVIQPGTSTTLYPDTYGGLRAIIEGDDCENGVIVPYRMRGGTLVRFLQAIEIPTATVPEDELRLSVDLLVTNPGEHFDDGGLTSARVISDPDQLCELDISPGFNFPGSSFSRKMQPNDVIPSRDPVLVSFGTGWEPGQFTLLYVSLTCPDDGDLVADFQIEVMALERVVEGSTSSSTEIISISSTESSTGVMSSVSASSPVLSLPTLPTTLSTTLPTTLPISIPTVIPSLPIPSLSLPTTLSEVTIPTISGIPTIPTSGTLAPTSSPQPGPFEQPPEIGSYALVGCIGSSNGFPSLELQESSKLMTPEICVSACSAGDRVIAATFGESCYCGDDISDGDGQFASFPAAQCNIPCPGNPRRRCGGMNRGTAARRDLHERQGQGLPSSVLLTVYVNIDLVVGGPAPSLPATGGTPAATVTVTLATASRTSGGPSTLPTPGPYPDGDEDWWSCMSGACAWEVIVLKPFSCDAGCDGAVYYELICDSCRAGEETWRPIRCQGGACRGKSLFRPERCSGGFCGEYTAVEEEACECEGGSSYRPRVRNGGGQASGGRGGDQDDYVYGSSTSSGGVISEDQVAEDDDESCEVDSEEVYETVDEDTFGGGRAHDAITPDEAGRTEVEKTQESDAVPSDRKDEDVVTVTSEDVSKGKGDDTPTENSFVMASSTSNLACLTVVIAGLLPFGLLHLM